MGTHYLAKSREVLQINDVVKLRALLSEQRAELKKISVGFGKKRMTSIGSNKAPVKNKKAIQNTRRNIARILTRLSQLKQKELNTQ